ncbi:aspartate ammonia-lyase [Kerstersia sp.]|uniref:aspartate ammonia-lyase n=1 Tax=Kerstersia sp. TaxID=1930783 RepID=UPI003F9250F8
MTDHLRTEADFLGSKTLPRDAYWGVHTARAVENFPVTGQTLAQMPHLIRALACVKKAAAQANESLGVIEPSVAAAIGQACDALLAGQWHDQFRVDVIQGGAGTSTNMNANEVIANLAIVQLGGVQGDYHLVHPNDDVNASQSTNDVYPTALRLAAHAQAEELLDALAGLRAAFAGKAAAFGSVLKIGRTQLQDAVPMTLGQEFGAFAATLAEDERRLREAQALLTEVNLGATAIGTGINTPAGYGARVIDCLARCSGLPVVAARDLVAATQDTGAFVQLSGALKRVAIRLSKIASDLRLLSSGPQAGLGDIVLPARQAGSSIMPGKVNPVIPEAMNQVAFEVIGHDLMVTLAAESGQLQLNAFEPLMIWALHQGMSHLVGACRTLQHNCVEGIEPNLPVLERRVAESVTLVTALNPIIGYENSARIVKQALASGGEIGAVAEALGILSAADLQRLLVPERLTRPAAPHDNT